MDIMDLRDKKFKNLKDKAYANSREIPEAEWEKWCNYVDGSQKDEHVLGILNAVLTYVDSIVKGSTDAEKSLIADVIVGGIKSYCAADKEIYLGALQCFESIPGIQAVCDEIKKCDELDDTSKISF